MDRQCGGWISRQRVRGEALTTLRLEYETSHRIFRRWFETGRNDGGGDRCGGDERPRDVAANTDPFARRDRGEISVFAGSMDDPHHLAPTAHAFAERQVAWLHMDDGLPRHSRHPPGNEDRDLE